MQYKESEIIELKRKLDDDMKVEIVAFLNSYLGGTIYVGVDDDGTLATLTDKEKDENESKVINWIRDEAVYPNCSDCVNLHYNEDGVLVIKVDSGNKKPYYLKSKGLKPSGVYIRYGRNVSQASQEEISRMIRERDNISYESLISKHQDLTFNALKLKFEEKGLDFSEFKMVTSGFIDSKTNQYTNLAFWFSDQYDVATKMAVYQGLDRSVFRTKKQYEGSIIRQIDNALEYYDLCNEVRIIINGRPMREEIPSYNSTAAREAILNCYCHRDFSRNSNIKIEFFDDRCEILSPGGFFDGLTLEQALDGVQSFRNEKLVQLLFKLNYIENYASGLSRIYKEYNKEGLEPTIKTASTMFKITLPNKNYEALYLNPQKHLDDNKSIVHGFTSSQEKKSDDISTLNSRDANIYKTIKLYPGLRYPQLEEYLKVTDPNVTRQIFSKRVIAMKDLIEFRGSSKTGGYFIK